MARDNVETCRDTTVAYGNARIGRHRNSRSNARHHIEFHAGIHQFQGFFTAASEHERIATLQASNNALRVFLRKLHQKLVDLGLLYLVVRGHLADIHHFRFRVTHSKNRRRNQAVIHHYIGFFKDFFATKGQKSRIAGASSNQVNMTESRHQNLILIIERLGVFGFFDNPVADMVGKLFLVVLFQGIRKSRQIFGVKRCEILFVAVHVA